MKEDSFVFISYQTGERIGDNTPMFALKRLLRDSRLPEIALHGFRHTHCTILLNKGANVVEIAKRLGNIPQMIYEIYGHVLEELRMETVTLFGSSLKDTGAKTGASSS